MPFSQLLAKLLDNVNLGKMLVDGGPGVLLALAILLFAAHSIPEDDKSTIPFLKLVVKKDLRQTRSEIKEFEEKAAELAGRSANEDQQLQTLAKRIAAAEQGRVGFESGMTGCREGSLCDMYGKVARLRDAKAQDDKRLEFVAKRLDELRAKLEKRKQEYIRDGRGLLSELISLCLGLSIFGYILGTLFSGVNYTLWILALQRGIMRTVGKVWEWIRLWFAGSAEEMAKIALQEHMRMMELRLGTAVVLKETDKNNALGVLTGAIRGAGGGDKRSSKGINAVTGIREQMEGPRALSTLPVTFYVGRGIISQQDYDGFVTGYFRWAEASANLIFPVLAFGYILHCIARDRAAGSPHSFNCLIWVQDHPFWLALILAIVLYVAAQLLYSDYKRRLRDFIKGKLDAEKQKREDAQKQKAEAPPAGPSPKPGRQRLEIIAEGDQAGEILKTLEKLLQGHKG